MTSKSDHRLETVAATASFVLSFLLCRSYGYVRIFFAAKHGAPTPSSSADWTKKGSFLLAIPLSAAEMSEAAQAAMQAAIGDSATSTCNQAAGRDLITQRDQQLGPNVSVFYRQDGGLIIVRGRGVFMEDIDGNLHLDCCNNVACVGHSHPKVVEAGRIELGNIQTNARFLNPVQQQYLAKLLKTFPPELNTVYLVNSGSEANDLALRIARSHSTAARRDHVAVLDSAYHGHTQSLVDISPYKWYQAIDGRNYHPLTTHVMSLPDGFRGKHRGVDTGAKYAAEVEDLVSGPDGGVGVFIAESIVGCGGQIVPPPGYLQRCYASIRRQGGVCIADEVQTGFARTGSHFWMFQRHGVVPDIVTCGKPIANGYPMAAVVCRRALAESFASSGIEYFNTFGGNSVACRIAEAVIDVIEEERLQDNALKVGAYLSERLQSLVDRYEWVGEARGCGLFQGVEFVCSKSKADRHFLDPFPELAKFLVDYLRYRHIIVSRDGPAENVIKIKPPLVFSCVDVDSLVDTMQRGLECALSLELFRNMQYR